MKGVTWALLAELQETHFITSGTLCHFLKCFVEHPRVIRSSVFQQEQRMSVKQKWGYDCPSAEVKTSGSRTTNFCHLHAFQMSTRACKMEAKKKLGESALKHIQAGWMLLPVLALTFQCPSAAAASSAASTTHHHVVTPLPVLDQGSGVNKSLLFKVV